MVDESVGGTEETMSATATDDRSTALPIRIAIAWVLALAALSLAGWAGEFVEASLGVGSRVRYGLQALIMSGIVVPGIWWLRTRGDLRPLEGLGVLGLRRSLAGFAIGTGIIALPVLLTVLLTNVFGWATVTVDLSASALGALAAGIGTVLFFEALPEELVFRGYIYRNLSAGLQRWVASLLTVGLFVLVPLALVPIQRHLLGMEISVGGASTITGGYVITMILFGTFVQYLRVLTGSIWTGVGFHLAFVLINRILGPRPTNLIRFSDIVASGPMQVTALASVILLLVALVAYPRLVGRPVGWRKTDPE
jgi:membrane protease YdiL (CAAX protease family)